MKMPHGLRAELVARGFLSPGETPAAQADGLTNHVWQVGAYCVKLFVDGEHSPLFPNSAVREWEALTRVSPQAIASPPRALFMVEGAAVIVSDWLDSGTDPVRPDDLGRLLARVHERAPVGTAGCDPLAEGGAILSRCADQSLWQYTPEAITVTGPSVYLHGDPAPGNIISTAQGLRLIDWQAATSGTAWHDIALALSPALRIVAGLSPWSLPERDALIVAAGLAPQDWARLAAGFHWRMACHCQWRIERGYTAYQAGLVAEIRAALRTTSPAG